MKPPVLIFGWGNPSRGDDALGPLLLERVEAMLGEHPEWGAVELLTDFQLQVEHALDLEGRDRVLFVDASARSDQAPFRAGCIAPEQDASFTTHALSPQGVMHVYRQVTAAEPPPCHLLAIAGQAFELGTPLSAAASAHLDAAVDWTRDWLAGRVPGACPPDRNGA
ncbi:Ni/Fe hydrogenase [Paramagnetospirillum marisnigri]|uniref:Ni/Fe hydrogenase n=1 Tax=Paramagnetospirillum marisnigri TaxID=1285242 RepID=A0A178MMG0_9PROT|nr:hydrogenase maturation protease [Paramagnetospirillum marisnigri]OAN49861.1 Ni/Fe hydrogenase [Paramagnetospirillum marisnigri]